jgi:SNF2 family DNA or RNA helicase
VKRTHIASAAALGVDRSRAAGGKYGAKLTAIVKKVKELVEGQDRVILFVQFDDLKEKVAEALQDSGVKSLQVQGSVANQIKALDVLQKETPAKDDPRVLLLTMDDESSAGVNLTTCNHAIFVHPLLAESQQQYNAYETQAIGRIRRYGQTKTVHIWRFIARDTIDSEIYEERTGKKLSW